MGVVVQRMLTADSDAMWARSMMRNRLVLLHCGLLDAIMESPTAGE